MGCADVRAGRRAAGAVTRTEDGVVSGRGRWRGCHGHRTRWFDVRAAWREGRGEARPGTRHGRVGDVTNPRDRGSGTVWAIALIGLIWSAGTVAMAVGGVRAARQRAYAAADLAALAAAANASGGPHDACVLAARVARASGARLRRCVLRERVSEVTVTSAVPLRHPFGPLVATAHARAGPSGLPDDGIPRT